MIRSRGTARPHRILLLAATALIPVLAGCEAGNGAPTQQWHQPTPGTSEQAGTIAISNVFVLGPSTGTLAAGQSASLFLALANEGAPDKLISITAPGTAARVTLPGGSISLPSQKVALLTGPAPQAVLTGLTRPLAAGGSVKLTLTFQKAGSVRLDVPVMARSEYYSSYSPAPTPTPTPTPTASKHHRATPASSPSPTPSAG